MGTVMTRFVHKSATLNSEIYGRKIKRLFFAAHDGRALETKVALYGAGLWLLRDVYLRIITAYVLCSSFTSGS